MTQKEIAEEFCRDFDIKMSEIDNIFDDSLSNDKFNKKLLDLVPIEILEQVFERLIIKFGKYQIDINELPDGSYHNIDVNTYHSTLKEAVYSSFLYY